MRNNELQEVLLQLEVTRRYIEEALEYWQAFGARLFEDGSARETLAGDSDEVDASERAMVYGLIRAVELVAVGLRAANEISDHEVEQMLDVRMSGTTVSEIIRQGETIAHRCEDADDEHIARTIIEDYTELKDTCAEVIAVLEERLQSAKEV